METEAQQRLDVVILADVVLWRSVDDHLRLSCTGDGERRCRATVGKLLSQHRVVDHHHLVPSISSATVEKKLQMLAKDRG